MPFALGEASVERREPATDRVRTDRTGLVRAFGPVLRGSEGGFGELVVVEVRVAGPVVVAARWADPGVGAFAAGGPDDEVPQVGVSEPGDVGFEAGGRGGRQPGMPANDQSGLTGAMGMVPESPSARRGCR